MVVLLVLAMSWVATPSPAKGEDHIRPYAGNPYDWQYEGEPVMLFGGSKDDNLFQIPDLKEHLDLTEAAGQFRRRWLDIERSRWTGEDRIAGGRRLRCEAPGRGNWAAMIVPAGDTDR